MRDIGKINSMTNDEFLEWEKTYRKERFEHVVRRLRVNGIGRKKARRRAASSIKDFVEDMKLMRLFHD